jgi:Reverse transcriptase (RNA-dependent DNA polymerase)
LQTVNVADEKTFRSFLQRGYLPEVFPPIFTSKRWSAGIDSKKVELDLVKDLELNKISYSCTKRGYGRRYFDFVHPVSAVSTSAWMSRHWKDVEKYCNHTPTAPVKAALMDDDESRCIVSCSFDRVLQEAKRRLSGARYVVRADVAKYYSSIYTHAIPWALNGKEAAKKDRSPISKTISGNELDWAIRIGQSNQTKGIPVGPDFSRAVGELVGIAIDRLVLEKIDKRHVGYVRNIDDFYIGASDLASAEAILHALQESLRAFELELNDDKTSVKEAHTLVDESWIHELDVILGSTPTDQVRAVDRAFDRAFYLADATASDSSLKYLVRTVDRLTSTEEISFEDIEHSLVRSMVSYPHCIDYCVLLFLKQHALGNANEKLWSDVIARELARHLSLSHDHETCWLLAALVGAEIKIGKLKFTPDPNRQITNTLLFHCLDRGYVEFDGSVFLDEVMPDSEINSNWLLSNEIVANNWSTTAVRTRISKIRKQIVGKNISFLNPDFLVDLDSKEARRAIPDRYNRYDEPDDMTP